LSPESNNSKSNNSIFAVY